MKGRMRECIDVGWLFHEGEADGAEQPSFDDGGWEQVDLPQDWTIGEPHSEELSWMNGFLPRGVGWYRKHLRVGEPLEGRRVFMEFEGVFRNSTLWVNGQMVGTHPWGYTGFVYDLTSFLRTGENLLAMRVDGTEVEGWWYEGCGIYRHIWLISTNDLHVDVWGTFITTPEVSERQARVNVRTTVRNDGPDESACDVVTHLVDAKGRRVAELQSYAVVSPRASLDVVQETVIPNPHLWSPDTPYLYQARTEVMVKGVPVDSYNTMFGLRWFEFTPDSGFFLNGKHLQLRGMNVHHDFGGLGVALPDRAHEKTVEVAKAVGCNLLRSAHNDPAPPLGEACDRLGLLLWAETRYLAEPEYAVPPLRALIRRNRNHPSIICWSLANSSGENDPAKTEWLRHLNRVAHEEDSTRPTAFACEANGDANASGFALVTDIMGYNGGGMGIDDRDHELFPDRRMLISEFAAGRGARGVYEEIAGSEVRWATLGDGRKIKLAGQYCSSYDLCLANEREWQHIAERPWLAGGLVWAGIDYYGETTGWPIVTSQFGVLDVCRFPTDAYYYFLQEWTEEPMVHIFPHWTWPGREGEAIHVWCYSNCEVVELFLNGVSLGAQPCLPHTHLAWQVPYQPGALRAEAINRGEVVCVKEVRTAGPSAKLTLAADHDVLASDGCDLSFVTIGVHDALGVMVPTASLEIAVQVSGPGKLLGLHAGDPGDHESPRNGRRRSFSGLLLAIVQSGRERGQIVVRASADDLAGGQLVLQSR